VSYFRRTHCILPSKSTRYRHSALSFIPKPWHIYIRLDAIIILFRPRAGRNTQCRCFWSLKSVAVKPCHLFFGGGYDVKCDLPAPPKKACLYRACVISAAPTWGTRSTFPTKAITPPSFVTLTFCSCIVAIIEIRVALLSPLVIFKLFTLSAKFPLHTLSHHQLCRKNIDAVCPFWKRIRRGWDELPVQKWKQGNTIRGRKEEERLDTVGRWGERLPRTWSLG